MEERTQPLLFRETFKVTNPEWVKVLRNTVFLTFSVDAPFFVDFCRPTSHSLMFCLLRFTCGNQELKSSANVMQSVMAHGPVWKLACFYVTGSVFFFSCPQTGLTFAFSSGLIQSVPDSQVHFPLSFTHRVVSIPYLKIWALERIWLVFLPKVYSSCPCDKCLHAPSCPRQRHPWNSK